MTKKSVIAREAKRVKLSAQARVNRLKSKKIISDPKVSYKEKMEEVKKLNKRPRDESPCRIKRRCRRCGRARAVYRKFALCRMCLRQAAVRGNVPGLLKASW